MEQAGARPGSDSPKPDGKPIGKQAWPAPKMPSAEKPTCSAPLPGEQSAEADQQGEASSQPTSRQDQPSSSRRSSTNGRKSVAGQDPHVDVGQSCISGGGDPKTQDGGTVKQCDKIIAEEGINKKKLASSGGGRRLSDQTQPAAKLNLRRKSEERTQIRKCSISLTPPRNDKRVEKPAIEAACEVDRRASPVQKSVQAHKAGIKDGSKKQAVHPTNQNLAKSKKENKNECENQTLDNVDQELKRKKPNVGADIPKSSADTTFKVPAPKKPGSNKTTAQDRQSKLGTAKNKGGGKAMKHLSPKSSEMSSSLRSTRASALSPSANLRTKKDSKERGGVCMTCNVGNKKNEKLVHCKDCEKIRKCYLF